MYLIYRSIPLTDLYAKTVTITKELINLAAINSFIFDNQKHYKPQHLSS